MATHYDRVPVGVVEHGEPLFHPLLLRGNACAIGVSGSGKSNGLYAALLEAGQLPNVAFVGVDPQRTELVFWKKRFSAIATSSEQEIALLEQLNEEADRRFAWLSAQGKYQLTEDDLETHPLLVLVNPELALTPGDPQLDALRALLLHRLAARGGPVGVRIWGATQKPANDVLPMSLVGLFEHRAAYATYTAWETERLLGTGAVQDGARSHCIGASEKGVCYVVNVDHPKPVRATTNHITDEQCASAERRTAHLRVELPWLSLPEDDGRQAPEASRA